MTEQTDREGRMKEAISKALNKPLEPKMPRGIYPYGRRVLYPCHPAKK